MSHSNDETLPDLLSPEMKKLMGQLENLGKLKREAFHIRPEDLIVQAEQENGRTVAEFTDRLPCRGTSEPEEEQSLLQLGFTLGEPITDRRLCDQEGRPVFRRATFPEGWRFVTDEQESRLAALRDNKGRKRGEMFVKATVYENKADLELYPRFVARVASMTTPAIVGGPKLKSVLGAPLRQELVLDYLTEQPIVLWASEAIEVSTWREAHPRAQYYDATEAKRYLDERYPLYRDPVAYWEDEHMAKIPLFSVSWYTSPEEAASVLWDHVRVHINEGETLLNEGSFFVQHEDSPSVTFRVKLSLNSSQVDKVRALSASWRAVVEQYQNFVENVYDPARTGPFATGLVPDEIYQDFYPRRAQ